MICSSQQISSLLWSAFGINRPDGKRTAPSASDEDETDVYVLLKSGAYVYSAASNRLDLVAAEDIRALGGTQAFVKDAPMTLVFVADLAKMGAGSDDNKKNTANIDVGVYFPKCLSVPRVPRAWSHRGERFGGSGRALDQDLQTSPGPTHRPGAIGGLSQSEIVLLCAR